MSSLTLGRATGLPPLRLDCLSRSELLAYFEHHWQLEEILFKQLVNPASFYLSPDPLRNPLIFYLGHSAVFYINKLVRVGLLDQRINPDYERLFEIGVDPHQAQELQQANQGTMWPEVTSVWHYRHQVREVVTQLIQTTPLTLPIHWEHPLWALLMAIEHSCIHFETSSMLIRQLPLEHFPAVTDWPYAPVGSDTPEGSLVLMPGGQVHLGKSADSVTYGWDSDYGDRRVEVKPFWCSPYLVTNQDYLAFVEAGGYENPDYWSPTAWQWRQENQVTSPKFWYKTPNGYRYRAMFQEMELPLAWPVEVNQYEAIAFCRWRGEGYRLCTEAEWRYLLQAQSSPVEATEPTDNLNFRWGSPSIVGSLETPEHDSYCYDLRGNVWEWTQDTFTALPGFKPHDLYDNYSNPFFDEQHFVMLGGSWASTGSYGSADCRNWFRPYFYQHAGFRLVKTATSSTI